MKKKNKRCLFALWGGEAMFELLVAVHHATTFTSLVPVEETNFVW